ncbi:glucose 1-dehydrogenase [Gordonia rubripertincta]|uniref:Glucose 1-dehydrogenase n=2 Tax=Gordonia rubripertincta TaxID=36822 RepID=A0ABT4MPE4_GORRU|nr:glucose 1-dehydrogenase [Gordonia rubripertincta]
MGRLEGKTAIVTGGAQGMGAATVRVMVEEGAKVVIADLAEQAGKSLAAELGDAASFCRLDVSNESDWQKVLAHTLEVHGTVNVLVNNAGIQYFVGVEDIDAEGVMRLFSINVLGSMLGVKTVAPTMKKAGAGVVINISSLDGLRGTNGMSPYVASKWAVRGLTKAQALELGPVIRVVSVHPGGVNTPMGNPTGDTGEAMNAPYGRIPLRRIGEPIEVARVTAFMASDEASYVSGSEIAVDGGWTAGHYHVGLPGGPEA